MKLDCGYGLDLIVEEGVILEIKAVEHLAPIHHEQLLSYLRFFGKKVGLILNFHERVLNNWLKRIVNGFPYWAFSATAAVNRAG